MKWITFVLAAWVCVGLQMGLTGVLELGPTKVAPSLVFVLAAFVAINAQPLIALWSSLALGLIMDLVTGAPLGEGHGVATIVGPNALGYLLACQLILAMRGMLNRRNPLSLAFLSLAGNAVAQIVVLTFFSLHRWYGDPIVPGGTSELWSRLGAALYTGVAGLALSLVLIPLSNAFGFVSAQQRRFSRV